MKDRSRAAHRQASGSAKFLAILGVGAWIATLAASDGPWWAATLFWLVLPSLLLLWIKRGTQRDLERLLTEASQALESGHAREVEVIATAVAVLEESETEVYQVDDRKMLCVVTWDDVNTEPWPPSRVRITQICTASDVKVLEEIVGDSPKLDSVVKFQSKDIGRYRWPDHLEVLDGTIAELPMLLRRTSAGSN